MKIFLLGFMGSGKTTLGKKLAARMKYNFIDLDEFIQNKTGKEIREIFRESGEEVFRQIESDNLRLLGEIENSIVSPGGGTPCFYDNMDWMNTAGYTVYLRQTPEFLYSRLKNSKTKRPLISSLDPEQLLEFIRKTLNEREKYYEKAQLVIDAKDMKAKEFEQIFLEHFPQDN